MRRAANYKEDSSKGYYCEYLLLVVLFLFIFPSHKKRESKRLPFKGEAYLPENYRVYPFGHSFILVMISILLQRAKKENTYGYHFIFSE